MKKFSSFLFVLLLMLASFTAGMEYPRGDVDQNGEVNIADVTCLIDYIMTGTWDNEPVTPPEDDGHEYVDLGLPSGTLWATMNIGSSKPEEYGDYFAWGETKRKDVYEWSTYKWCEGTDSTMTKYCIHSNYGTIDNKTELEPEDDAAYVNWGPLWRTPTAEQQQELIDHCSWIVTTSNGKRIIKVTGPNGNSMLLPATGYVTDSWVHNVSEWGYYWSRDLNPNQSSSACFLAAKSGFQLCSNTFRYLGVAVRAVRVQ